MIAAAYITLASILDASERERERERERENRHVKDKTEFMIFSLVTLVIHFLIVMVGLLDFQGQRMCQGHHPV